MQDFQSANPEINEYQQSSAQVGAAIAFFALTARQHIAVMSMLIMMKCIRSNGGIGTMGEYHPGLVIVLFCVAQWNDNRKKCHPFFVCQLDEWQRPSYALPSPIPCVVIAGI